MSRRVYVAVVTVSITVLIATAATTSGDGSSRQLQAVGPIPSEAEIIGVRVEVTTTLISFEDVALAPPPTTAPTIPVTTTTAPTTTTSPPTTAPPTTAPPETTTTTTAPPPPPPTTTTEPPTTTTETDEEKVAEVTTVVARRHSGGWAALIQCESGGNYSTNTGNGYYGAYQFDQATWNGVVARMGRADLVGVRASSASPSDQDAAAQQLYSERGSQPWPVCGAYVG